MLARTARLFGLCALAVVGVCLLLPGAVDALEVPATVALLAAAAVSVWMLGRAGRPFWILAVTVTGLALLVVLRLPVDAAVDPATTAAIGFVAGGPLASVALPLVRTRRGSLMLAVLFLIAVAAVAATSWGERWAFEVVGLTAVSWALSATLGVWLAASFPRAAELIEQQKRAHRAERAASEHEARRRQSARLLHDTVLATLTLLAHSGVGVSAAALKSQAADDARLLRQLRLGGAPTPRSGGPISSEPVSESTLGHTLQSVKQRFTMMGLEVRWHGSGQVLLRPDVLDAFLLALIECLENVRRHAGVRDAQVTIKDDGTVLRALVTDAGVGFHLADVADGRLGVKESLQARLREVGGSARVFSAPGSGTTVVLEVPK